MDLQSRKEVIRFNDTTEYKNVTSLKDIVNYLTKGFKIEYKEEKGEKIATKITRFDILQTVDPKDKLDKAAFKKLMSDKNTVIYDARPPMAYQAGFIPGAKLLPAPAFDKFKDKLPADKNKTIIFYCVGGCLSPSAAMKTKALGYKSVKIYVEGFPDWSKTEFSIVAPDWVKNAIAQEIPHVLVDLRPTALVSQGHIKGAVGIPFRQLAAFKAKFPKQKNAPIIFYGPSKDKAAQMVVGWGYKAVRILPIEFEQWQKDSNPVQTGAAKQVINFVPKPKPGSVTMEMMATILKSKPADTVIIDVRGADEFAEGHLKGAINIPNEQLAHRLNEIDQKKNVIVYCVSGLRAEMAYTTLMTMKFQAKYLDANIKIAKDGTYKLN